MTGTEKRHSGNLRLGKTGEEIARRFLKDRGYRLVKTNYRSRLGEIDIVCEDGETVVFVEVKYRTSERFGTPAAAVTPVKQERLRRLAEEFLIAHNLESRPVRFDVLGIVSTARGVEIEHLLGAF